MFDLSRGAFRACLIAGALVAALPASAKTVSLKQTARDIAITLPDAWSVKPITDGVQIKSPDDEVYVWVEAVAPAQLTAAIDAYFEYYKKEGVTFTGGTNETKGEIGGVAVSILEPPAIYEGKTTIVRFIFAAPKPGVQKALVIGYWASPKGDKAHDAPVTRIMQDLLQ